VRSNVASASIDGYCPIEDCGIVKDSVLLLSLRRLWSAGGSSTSALMMRKNLKGMVVMVGIGRRWVVEGYVLGLCGWNTMEVCVVIKRDVSVGFEY